MFIPSKFRQRNIEELISIMQKYSFAALVTQSETGIEATHLPMIVSSESDKLYLKAHIARANPIWESVANGSNVLVIFNGPNCYISPNHYPTKKEAGKAVPTWNYVVVHVEGLISFIHDSEWIYDAIDTLTTTHEAELKEPWSMSDAPEEYIQKMLPAIVGIEIEITSMVGQWKLSQNQPAVNQRGVVDGLSRSLDSSTVEVACMVSSNIEKVSS